MGLVAVGLRLIAAVLLAYLLWDSVQTHRCPCHDPVELPSKEMEA